jgi:hypothetical protein
MDGIKVELYLFPEATHHDSLRINHGVNLPHKSKHNLNSDKSDDVAMVTTI